MFVFARICPPNIFIEKLSSAHIEAGDPPKRNFGKSSHKQCPVMLGLERNAGKLRIKREHRPKNGCPSPAMRYARDGVVKVFSGKVSIVM